MSAHRLVIVCGLALSSGGCLMAGNYHSAKTLEKGTSQFGMTMSLTNYEARDESSGEVTRVSLPNLIPEITYHIGITDDVEVGGRAALGSLALEGDAKIRFLQSDKLHMAVAPAIGYQALVFASGVMARLPVILSYEIGEHMDFNIAAFAMGAKYTPSDDDLDSSLFNGTGFSAGGAIGVDIHTETFHIRPAVEAAMWRFENEAGDTAEFNTVSILVHIAWTGGKEKKQLNRIEDKIDRIVPPPAAPPPPPPSEP